MMLLSLQPMSRILSIDYGTKICGLAATDPLQLIVNGITTVSTAELQTFLELYCSREDVEEIVIGLPHHPDGTPSQLAQPIQKTADSIEKLFPEIKVTLHDESMTTKEARQIILASGASRRKRRNKHLVDEVSAVLILQDYLQHYS